MEITLKERLFDSNTELKSDEPSCYTKQITNSVLLVAELVFQGKE